MRISVGEIWAVEYTNEHHLIVEEDMRVLEVKGSEVLGENELGHMYWLNAQRFQKEVTDHYRN